VIETPVLLRLQEALRPLGLVILQNFKQDIKDEKAVSVFEGWRPPRYVVNVFIVLFVSIPWA
jgi:hypothetical protein